MGEWTLTTPLLCSGVDEEEIPSLPFTIYSRQESWPSVMTAVELFLSLAYCSTQESGPSVSHITVELALDVGVAGGPEADSMSAGEPFNTESP